MNKNILCAAIMLFIFYAMPGEVLNFAVANAQKNQKIGILLVSMGTQTNELKEIVSLVKKALEFKDQCQVTTLHMPTLMSKQEAIEQKNKGAHYIVFVEGSDKNNIEWHLFDVDAGRMIKNKRVAKKGAVVRGWAYALADSITETLTNDPGFFSTKIAFVKQFPLKNGTHYTHLYVADYDGSNPQIIVETPTVNVNPRWNNDSARPLLFYSENTNTNMRMLAVDLHKKRIVASNFDGLNMLPAFAPDGRSVIYCATRGSGNCHIYQWAHKSLKKITQNEGNNFSPVFTNEGKSIYYSSDCQGGNPKIYCYDLENNHTERITNDGYCVSPTWCPTRNQLAYSKMVNGVMQLWVYDLGAKQHRQLTFDKAQKEECMWSTCGTFLLCSVEDNKTSQIALFNVNTSEFKFLTGVQEKCSNPAWSKVYNEYPVIA